MLHYSLISIKIQDFEKSAYVQDKQLSDCYKDVLVIQFCSPTYSLVLQKSNIYSYLHFIK